MNKLAKKLLLINIVFVFAAVSIFLLGSAKAAYAVDCQTYPFMEGPDGNGGARWVANCSRTCANNTECPDYGDGNLISRQKGWCNYDIGRHCLTLQYLGDPGITDTSGCDIIGWACDKEGDPNNPIKVKFYEGRDNNTEYQSGSVKAGGRFLGEVMANLPREDAVKRACNSNNGLHGYKFSLPSTLRDGKSHDIYAYGVLKNGLEVKLWNNEKRNNWPAVSTCSTPISSTPSSTPPPAPTLAGSCAAGSLTPSLRWSAVTGATSYQVRVDPQGSSTASYSGNNCGPHAVCVDGFTGTSLTFQGSTGGTYDAWVHATNAAGQSSAASAHVIISCAGSSGGGSPIAALTVSGAAVVGNTLTLAANAAPPSGATISDLRIFIKKKDADNTTLWGGTADGFNGCNRVRVEAGDAQNKWCQQIEVSDNNTATTTWIPQQAGDYTIFVMATDSAGHKCRDVAQSGSGGPFPSCGSSSKQDVTVAPAAGPTASPAASPTGGPVSSPTVGPTTPPAAVYTVSFRIAENLADFTDTPFDATHPHGWQTYYTEPIPYDFLFASTVRPGPAFIWVEFKDSTGRVERRNKQIRLLGDSPIITGCSLDSEGSNTIINLAGSSFGTDRGTAKSNTTDLTVRKWNDTAVQLVWANAPSGKTLPVTLTNTEGQSGDGTCNALAQLALGAKVFCRQPFAHQTENVELVIAEAATGGKLIKQKVTIDKDGVVQGLTKKLEAGKNYFLSLKAPKSLRRTIAFTAEEGTTNTPNLVLPVGDIYPVDGGDDRINAPDKAVLNSQFELVKKVCERSGDFNQDCRVNSVDWACMRVSMEEVAGKNQSDPEPTPGLPEEVRCAGYRGLGCFKGYTCQVIGDQSDSGGICIPNTPVTSPGTELACGGIAGKACPSGYDCKLDGSYPDAAGKCVIKCPTYTPPVPDWCKDGTIIPRGKDANGCQLNPLCKKSDLDQCTADSDCISIRADGCGCSAGGTATAINKTYQDQWLKDNPDVACPAVMSTDVSCINKIPKCISNKCQLVPNPSPST